MGLFREIAEAINRQTRTHAGISQQILAELRQLNKTLRRFISVPNPGPIHVINIKESSTVPDIFTFDVQLPALPPAPHDIEGGQLTIVIDGGEPSIRAVAKADAAGLVSGLEGPQGATVDLSYSYLDDAGNLSANPSTASVVLDDKTPPPDPGAMGIVVTGERDDDTPA